MKNLSTAQHPRSTACGKRRWAGGAIYSFKSSLGDGKHRGLVAFSVGDEDGVVVIRPDDASAIAREARAILEAEQQKRVNYQNGKCSLDWVNEKLRALNLEEVDG